MTIKQLFITLYGTLILGLCLLAIIAVLMLNNEKALNHAQQVRYESYIVADELRQSSQDLTRLARNYVSTGDSKYEDMYWEVIAIRSGKKVRTDGRKISLNDIMKNLGFTDAEFAKLKEAAVNSEGLIWTETVAMNAVKGKFHDASKKFTITKEPDLPLARKLMFDNQYHQYVKEIMTPIDIFFQMLDKRTKTIVGELEKKNRSLLRMSITLIVILSFICLYSFFLITKNIINPVAVLLTGVVKIGDGDLTVTFANKGKDEIGQLSKTMNKMTQNLREIFKGFISNSETLNRSSDNLLAVAANMLKKSKTNAAKVNSVADSIKEMSSNMNSIAAASEESSVNVNMVASAAEEMSSTIGEISDNTTETQNITEKAVAQSSEASKRINTLGSAAQEIGKVTETITDISAQTNLLALNATIEAARAGEAGKGFAVVANEIKDLAKQTSDATAEIKEKINSIQEASVLSVTDINDISGIIVQIDEKIQTVSQTVEEQSGATQEISTNISQASEGIQEVNQNVAEVSSMTQEIATDIGNVSNATMELDTASGEVDVSAKGMKEMTAKLIELSGRFKV